MFDWVCRNRDVFLMNYIEIGNTYKSAKTLQEEHNHFTLNSMVSLISVLYSVIIDQVNFFYNIIIYGNCVK